VPIQEKNILYANILTQLSGFPGRSGFSSHAGCPSHSGFLCRSGFPVVPAFLSFWLLSDHSSH
jgi:hypothetical protein